MSMKERCKSSIAVFVCSLLIKHAFGEIIGKVIKVIKYRPVLALK